MCLQANQTRAMAASERVLKASPILQKNTQHGDLGKNIKDRCGKCQMLPYSCAGAHTDLSGAGGLSQNGVSIAS